MLPLFTLLIGLFAALHPALSAPVTLDDASSFCVTCFGRRLNKPLFINPVDCHQYYSCFFHNETVASGILNSCPVGTFFNDDIQTCVPEGTVQCSDRCRDDSVEANGCYGVDGSCSAFYYCSRGISCPFCCPIGTSLNASSCGCDLDATCADACTVSGPPVATTVAPPTNLDSSRCVDSFGIVLGVYVNAQGIVVPSFFRQLESDAADSESYIRACAPGSEFSLEACRCDLSVTVTNDNNYRQCSLYLPFDSTTADSSVLHLDTVGENVAIDSTEPARGSGSALFGTNSYIQVSGLPGVDYGKTLSICLFYKSGGASLSKTSGLLTNSKSVGSADYAFDLAAYTNNTVIATLSLLNPASQQSIVVTVSNQASWNQICIVYDGEAQTLISYVNGAQQSSKSVSGRVNLGHCAVYVGNDFAQNGAFDGGHIDDVLLCREALTTAEVQAHYNGEAALQSAGLIPSPRLGLVVADVVNYHAYEHPGGVVPEKIFVQEIGKPDAEEPAP